MMDNLEAYLHIAAAIYIAGVLGLVNIPGDALNRILFKAIPSAIAVAIAGHAFARLVVAA